MLVKCFASLFSFLYEKTCQNSAGFLLLFFFGIIFAWARTRRPSPLPAVCPAEKPAAADGGSFYFSYSETNARRSVRFVKA